MMGSTLDLQRLLTWRPGKLAKGTLAMTAGMGFRTLGQTVVFLIVARVLGVEAYGAYSAVLALAMTLGGFGGLGASMIMLRETARDPMGFAQSWGRTLAALVITAPLLLIVYLLLAGAVLPDQVAWFVIICIGCSEIMLAPLTLAAVQAYQGHERIGRASRLVLAPILPRLVGALILPLALFLPMAARLPLWALVYLLAASVSASYALWLLRKDFDLSFEFRWRGLAQAIREGWPFAVGGAANKVYVDIDKIMLARLATLEGAGVYSAAYRVVDMAGIPLMSFFSAAASRFFRAGEGGVRSAASYALKVLPLPMVYAVVVGAALYALAGLLPWLLGKGFAPAVEALQWLAWLPLLTTPRRFMQTVLGASGWQRVSVLVLTCGAVFNVALNLWMIPIWGWWGAVVATYLTECMMIGSLLSITMRGGARSTKPIA